MNTISDWIKSNLPVVVSATVGLACLSVSSYILFSEVPSINQKASGNAKKQFDDIKRMMSNSVEIPGRKIGESSETVSGLVINQDLLNRITIIQSDREKMGLGLSETVMGRNKHGHQPYYPNIFPGSAQTLQTWQTMHNIRAKTAYEDMFGIFAGATEEAQEEAKAKGLPTLRAIEPLTEKYLQSLLDAEVTRLVLNYGDKATFNSLDEAQQKNIEEKAYFLCYNEILQHASSGGLYAGADLKNDENKSGATDGGIRGRSHSVSASSSLKYPFAGLVRTWQKAPSLEWAWECQMDLWVTQDLIQVISDVNRIDDPKRSVANPEAPIKALYRLDVCPGSVGLHNKGLVVESSLPAADVPSKPTVKLTDKTVAQPLNFFLSPTGRATNALYDVRHARLELLVDTARLHEVLSAFDKVNYMTVISMQWEDKDEYDLLKNDRIYVGNADVGKVTMVVETIWDRSWIEPLMPAQTREYMLAPAVVKEQE